MSYKEIFNRSLATANEVDRLYQEAMSIIRALSDTIDVRQLLQMHVNIRYLKAEVEDAIQNSSEALESMYKTEIEDFINHD